MAANSIRNIEDILKLNEDQRYVTHTEKLLTAAGENYGSLMLLLEVKVKNLRENCEEIVSVVGKTLPPNEFLRTIFNVTVTFVNELNFYKILVPSFEQFVKRQIGDASLVDIFPKYYGGRLSLTGDSVDEDATLLLENLNLNQFKCLDRFAGLNLECTEFILKKLAIFHAIPLAMRCLEPAKFAENYAHIKTRDVNHAFDDFMDGTVKRFRMMMEHDEYCISIFPKLEQLFRNVIPKAHISRKTSDKYTSIVHKDMWVNNFMVKTVDGKPVECKFIDFQMYELGSLCSDLLFFLFTSVQSSLIAQHYDQFVRLYYDYFIETLNKLKYNTSSYNFDEFLKEIDADAKFGETMHCLMMVNPILAQKGSIADMSEVDINHMNNQEINQMQKDKTVFLIKEFAKKDWF